MERAKRIIFFGLAGVMALSLSVPLTSTKALTLGQKHRHVMAKYQTARAQYLKEVNWYKSARQQFLGARAKYRKFKNAENKAAYEEQARVFLEKTVEVLIKRLESLKTWVSNRGALSDDDKAAIMAEIEEDIKWLTEKKGEISSASGEQIREKAQEVRQYWHRHRAKVKKIIGQIWGARLNWAISRFESVSEKTAAKIEELKAAGVDTTKLEAWLDDMNRKINLAKEKYEAAKVKYEAISSAGEANQLFNESHRFIKEARDYLRQAHQELRQIIQEMKTIKVTVSDTTTTTNGK
jgi:hypothetical protein